VEPTIELPGPPPVEGAGGAVLPAAPASSASQSVLRHHRAGYPSRSGTRHHKPRAAVGQREHGACGRPALRFPSYDARRGSPHQPARQRKSTPKCRHVKHWSISHRGTGRRPRIRRPDLARAGTRPARVGESRRKRHVAHDRWPCGQ
jgi:hypothetical protein